MDTKFLAVRRRPAVVGLMFGIALTGAFFLGRAQAQQQEAPGIAFDKPALMYVQIKADQTADYEAVVAKLKEAIEKTENPDLKRQGAGWKIYKSDAPGPNNTALYVHLIDPPVANVDYSTMKILYDAFPAESQTIYTQYREVFVGQSAVKMTLVADLGK
jgi:hypothetical protein